MMKSSGPNESLTGAQDLSTTSSSFSLGLGTDGPSSGRKAPHRGRNSSVSSRIPHWPAGDAGPSALHGASTTQADASVAPQQQAQASEHPYSNRSMHMGASSAAPNASMEGVFPTPRELPVAGVIPHMPHGSGPVPTFAVGACDGLPLSMGTPRNNRPRSHRSKANGISPHFTAMAPTSEVNSTTPFSLLGVGILDAMTPINDNTYQKMAPKAGLHGTPTPMDVTPQVSTGSTMSNIFLYSPLLVGSFGGGQQGASNAARGDAEAGCPGHTSPASSAPIPFGGFTSEAAVALAPAEATAAAAGPSVPGTIPTVLSAASAQASGLHSGNSGSTSTSGINLRFPIHIQIPGAREVQDMFTSSAPASEVPENGFGSKGGGAPAASVAPRQRQPNGTSTAPAGAAGPPRSGAAAETPFTMFQQAPQTARSAAVFAAAAKKLPDFEASTSAFTSAAAKGGVVATADGGHSNQTGNDCQPTKDNDTKAARFPVEIGGSATAISTRNGMPGATAFSAAGTISSGNVATAAAALGLVAASAAAVAAVPPSDATSYSPDILAAVAEQLEHMARRTREAAVAAAAAPRTASVGANYTATVEAVAYALASESNLAIKSVIEIMLRPGAMDVKLAAAAAAARESAPQSAPGLAAAVSCMLGALRLDGSQATQKATAVGSMGFNGTTAGGSSGDGSRGSSAGSVPAVPFVFGGSTSGGGSSGNSHGGLGSAPALVAPILPPAFGSSAAERKGMQFSTVVAAGQDQGLSMAPTGPVNQPPLQHPSAIPFVVGVPGASGCAGEQSTATTAAAALGSTNLIPGMFGLPSSGSQARDPKRSTSPGNSTCPPFMLSGDPSQQQQQQAVDAAGSQFAKSRSAVTTPMSTTPVSGGQQASQPIASTSSSGWAGVIPASAPSGESFTFTMGDSGAPVANGGVMPFRVGGRARGKVTPRKARFIPAADSGATCSQSGGGDVATATAVAVGAAPTPTPGIESAPEAIGPQPTAATGIRLGHSAASVAANAEFQHQATKPPTSFGTADSGLDSASVEAVRLKRAADEKKQYGNQKYEDSDFRSAERWYTEAIELLEGKLQQLGLGREKLQQLFPNLRTEVAVLYSNRSGSRLMTSKPHSALADALRAMELDPKFMRAVSRAATCHCRLGDFAAAHRIVNSAMDRCSASSSHYQDMLKKLTEVLDLGSRARAATSAAVAAVSHGSRERLQEAADQLAAIRDPVGYCDVVASARAVLALRLGFPREVLALVAPHPEVPLHQRAAPWRMWLTIQAHYFKGDLQEALIVNKELQLSLEAAGPGLGETRSAASSGQEGAAVSYATSVHVTVPPPEVLGELGDALQQMLKMKEDGNAAIRANRHSDASELYTRALALGCCPTYAALLHANRAAAHAAQGAIADAVADCGRARALDPSYYKASTRLASYMVELRRPDDAQGLLEPLSKLSSQSNGAGPRPEELTLIKERFTEVRSAAAWQKTPHHYKLLGLSSSCSEDDVKKAYRRLALKHHPDKALAAVKVSMTLPERAGGAPYSGPVVGGSELETRIREEAAWLFNFINQAHEELSDKVRRRKVDHLLDTEQAPHCRYGSGTTSNSYASGWHNGVGVRYGGFSSYCNTEPFVHRPGGSGQAGGAGTAGGTTGNSRGRSAGGASAPSGGFGGYANFASFAGSRPGSARQAPAAGGAPVNGAARGGTGTSAGAGAARNGSGAGGGTSNMFGGHGRGGAAGAGTRPAAGGRKWWQGGNDYSDEDDEDTFNF